MRCSVCYTVPRWLVLSLHGLVTVGTLLFAVSINAVQSETLIMNTAHYPPRSYADNSGFEDRLIIEGFRRIGVGVKIVHLPSERCLINADSGIDDGNFARVEGLTDKYPNLVMVPESITAFEFTVFTKQKDLKVNSWEELKQHSVGIIGGWKILEEKTRGGKDVKIVKDHTALFNLLDNNRVDLVIIDRLEGVELLRQRNQTNDVAIGTSLATKNMYIYLHRRHAALIPPLTKAIKSMKKDGTFRKFGETSVASAP